MFPEVPFVLFSKIALFITLLRLPRRRYRRFRRNIRNGYSHAETLI